jgi:hypothetical protein
MDLGLLLDAGRFGLGLPKAIRRRYRNEEQTDSQ